MVDCETETSAGGYLVALRPSESLLNSPLRCVLFPYLIIYLLHFKTWLYCMDKTETIYTS